MEHISRQARVSTATVSRVINNKGHVSTQTRETVLKAIKDLGYRPPLRNFVGLIVPDSSNPFFSRLSFDFERIFAERDFHLLVSSSEGQVDREMALIEQMIKLNIKGLIFITAGSDDQSVLRLIAEPDVPVILFDRPVHAMNMDCVSVDNAKGTQTAVDYLMALGHTRIAYVHGLLGTQTGQERFTSFCRAMEYHKVTVDGNLIFEGDFQLQSGKEAARKLLNMPECQRPTALIAANDLMAIGVMKHLQENNMRIPQDISIIGFDDIEIAEWIYPGLTTISQPIGQLILEATKLLLSRIDDVGKNRQRRRPPQPIMLEPRLIVRGSTAKVKTEKENL